tara:strand:- start:230 stop:535 length:306 start_codon:yes stop_codon:yes gene_type:complete
MSSRYEHTNAKKSLKVRGKLDVVAKNTLHKTTTRYKAIPKSNGDIYVITQPGDRLDSLANRFYGDVNLWWYIAKANNLSFMTLPAELTLRIPDTTQYAIGT